MLKGSQKKLDKNNNGRIDAEDFKLLRDSKKGMRMGGMMQGMGAARTSGMGLQDESMKPGVVMKARAGASSNKRMAIAAMKTKARDAKKPKDTNMFKEPMGAMGGGMMKYKKGKMIKIKKVAKALNKASKLHAGQAKTLNTVAKARVGAAIKLGKQAKDAVKKKFSSMDEMRQAKGFKPGESVDDFNKRKMAEERAARADKAVARGKKLLPVAGAGILASQLLISKGKRKDQPKKRMGGVMKARTGKLADAMKKLREKAYEKSGKKMKGVGRFGKDQYMIQKKLPGMKTGKAIEMLKVIPTVGGKKQIAKPVTVSKKNKKTNKSRDY
jgi:hypothetical protein